MCVAMEAQRTIILGEHKDIGRTTFNQSSKQPSDGIAPTVYEHARGGRKVTDRIAQHLSTEISIAVTLSARTTAEEVICAKSCFAALVISTN